MTGLAIGGLVNRSVKPQLCVRFDQEAFDDIRNLAIQHKLSVSEVVRWLTDIGLVEVMGE